MFDLIPFRKRNEDFFGQMFKSFNGMVDDHWLAPFSSNSQTFRTDIREENDRYLVEAELPGIAKEDIDIDIAHNYLTIRAKRNEYHEEKDDTNKMIRRERRSGEFVRRFYVDHVDEEGIKAKLDQGVLKLEIPKRQGDDRSRRQIQID
ncbi:Hsp20/alpha crystallin family protein [Paenibacillus polymyxa]|uniref:Hsp20/alpha crystallin family protein n=1 Tax=Paenibacillus TaxID=44249 RepID=UPI0001E31886|nr:Hsp20/alpha crystallin family protein [Paenibacillus polymyxa]ADM71172.1 heat shock protein Hsp20 [Paenibacillus polymyxa E681]AOK89247.1 heat-shock protein Hsp20 [Paenibacillus polymyxa]KYG95205.1 heat-shock protein Hsp20 [Paenibacillus polymyxa]QNV58193.1 18 kDa heat shock protein [Paenibacillus polymyxa E681]QNV63029.1 18 kDa heat shock protein [Paenibacillus polymyxa E681]